MALAAVSLVLIALVLGGAARGGRPGGTPDRKPPSPPTKIRAISATPSALSLVWNGSRDNVGVAGYYVQADRRRARVFVPAYTVKGLSCNETVSVRIVAYDRAGNRSKIARARVSTATCIALTVSKAGNDATCRRGQLSRPCATFNRAYALAKCRDVVEVKAGSYGDQDIADTSRDCPKHARVVIRRELGAPVVVRKIQLGTTREDWGFSTDGPDDLTLSGFKLTWGFMVYSDAKNIVADRMDGGSFLVAGDDSDPSKAPDGITIRNSDWGPCTPAGSFRGQFSDCTTVFEQHPPGKNGEGQNQIAQGARNVLVERNTIHDFVIDRAGAHWECFWINGGHNVTFRANKLWNCETTVWSVGEHSGQSLTGTWYFENNWVGRARNSGTSLNFTQYPYNGKVIVRFNSFGPLQSSGGEEAQWVDNGTIKYIGNIFGRSGVCVPGATYAYNFFVDDDGGRSDRLCGGTGNKRMRNFPYVNRDRLAAMDYHLARRSVADRYVPAAVPHSGLATDYDRRQRRGPRTAGSDERLER